MTKGIEGPVPTSTARPTAAQTRAVALAQERKGLAVVDCGDGACTASPARACSATRRPRRAAPRSTTRTSSPGPPACCATAGRPRGCCYKLDGGIDHILVDEAQDTSPEQWQVIERWPRSSSPARPARGRAHAVRRRRREAVDLQLPGRGPAHVRRDGPALRSACRGGRRTVAAHAARSVVPHRRRRCCGAVDRVFADPERTPG